MTVKKEDEKDSPICAICERVLSHTILREVFELVTLEGRSVIYKKTYCVTCGTLRALREKQDD